MNLLIIDHMTSDREIYRSALAALSAETTFCVSGYEAQEVLLASTSPIDAILLLWELKGRPGAAELLTHFRRDCPETRVLIVGSTLKMSVAAIVRKLGAHDFLLKSHLRERIPGAILHAEDHFHRQEILSALRTRMTGRSPAFEDMLRKLALAIHYANDPVLLVGENGTGKELLARSIHDLGSSSTSPWVAVNIASIPDNLVESTLFGHEVGAFTGAESRRIGLFEESGNGTLFLDEIGEMELSLQAKLLRVVQERSFRRVGGSVDLSFEGRLVCATNRDLYQEVDSGRFRRDLYHRINTFEITVPPLRERGDDVWLLTEFLLRKGNPSLSLRLSPEAKDLLGEYAFPGNVRELETIVKQGIIRCKGDIIGPLDLPIELMERRPVDDSAAPLESIQWPEGLFTGDHRNALKEIEQAFNRHYLFRKLQESDGKKERAAQLAGLDPKTFRNKCRDCGLDT